MLLEFENVSKSYHTNKGTKTILDNVSFTVEKGKNIGILGSSGAGKSTMVRLIGGVQRPDQGIIRRGGRFSWPMGFKGGFNSNLTGEENLRFIARIYGADLKKVKDFVEQFSELGDYLYMPLNTYSSGMRTKLAFGLSMAIDFDCYLIDEIMGVGDVRFQEKSRDFFKSKKDHANLIIISHNIKNIIDNCDVAAILHEGKLQFYEDVKDAIRVYRSMTPAKIKSPKRRAGKRRMRKGNTE